MSLRRYCIVVAAVALSVCCLSGAPLDDAKKLYKSGRYAEAVDKLLPLRKSSPRDGNVSYWLGASLVALDRAAEAVPHLEAAEDRGVADASRMLVTIALDNYDVDGADEHIDTWAEKLKKAKKPMPESYDSLRSRMVMLRNMLERVEKIEFIDSISVDSAEFFTHYRLSPEAGQLLSADESDVRPRTVVYMPQNRSEMIWAESDSTGTARLMSASILDDGTVDRPTLLQGDFAPGGDADYPFLMPDGMTLYYAATGDNSMGGYDIFMTRRTDDGFLQPQNMGMPYNSPYNDYMLAIDETTGAGWFASDRSAAPGKVTIYVFAPSQTRVNYPADDPMLAYHAQMSSLEISNSPAAAAARDRIASLGEDTGTHRHRYEFEIAMGNGRICRTLDDFHNRQARLEMAKWLNDNDRLKEQRARLDKLRERYRAGDRGVADDILDAEAAIEYTASELTARRNKIIRLETR